MKHFKQFFVFALLALFSVGAWGADVTGTINFGSASGSTAVNATSVTGNDSQGNEWTITTVISETSFTQNASYSQIGASKKPATSIEFTMTFDSEVDITAFSAKFGGFSGTAGDISLKVGTTEVGSGSLDATNDVVISKSNSTPVSGTTLTVSVTGIAKGVKAYYISYTYAGSGAPDPVLESIVISGTPDKDTYEAGEFFDPTGLVATGYYDNSTNADITSSIEWAYTPAGALTQDLTSVNVTATSGTVVGNKDVDITVNAHVVTPGEYDILLSNEFWGVTSGSQPNDLSSMSGVSHDISITTAKGSNAMYSNDAQTRFYTNATLTMSVPSGYAITSIVFAEPSSQKTWNGSISVDEGTYTDASKSWEGEANSVTFTFGAQNRIATATVTYEAYVAPTVAVPTFSVAEGTYLGTQSVEINCATVGADIYYTLDGTDPSSASTPYSSAISITETKTLRAIAIKGSDESAIASATYTIVAIEHAGTEVDPYSVADAVKVIDVLGTQDGVYVSGIVSQIVTAYNPSYGNISFNISADGATSGQQFQAFRCKSFSGANFSSADDVVVGATAVVYGNLKKHNSTYELDADCYLAAYEAPTTPKTSIANDKDHPYTVAQAITYAADGITYDLDDYVYVSGVVYDVKSFNSTNGTLDIYIKDAGESNQFELYKCAGINDGSTTTPFNALTDVQVDDEVIAYGQLTVYGGLSELKQGNYLVELNRPTVPVTSINLTESTATVEEGKTVTLHASVLPDNATDQDIVWTVVSGDTYASVDNGVVTGIAAGEAVIRAASHEEASIYAECTVTVTEPAPLSPWATVYTSNVEMSGATASTVVINAANYDAMKAGTSSAAGSIEVAVPAQATTIHFHASGWSGREVTLNITAPDGITVTPASVNLTADAGVSGNETTYTLENDPSTTAYFAVALSGNTDAFTLTFANTGSKKQFVLFGVNQEGGVLPVLESIEISGDLTNKTGYKAGDALDLDGLTVEATYSLGGVNQTPVDITNDPDLALTYDPLVENQTEVTITASYKGQTDDITITGLDPVASADPLIYVSKLNVNFASVEVGDAVPAAQTITVTLTNVASVTATLGGTNADAFSISPTSLTSSGDITISILANTDVATSYSATLTISDGEGGADDKTVNLSFAVTEPVAEDDVTGTWTLVTNATTLAAGKKVIIAQYVDADGAINTMAGQATNNRSVIASTVAGTTLTPAIGTKVMTLAAAGEGKFYLMTSAGEYLYNASTSSKSYLKTKDESEDASWTISVTAEGVATITSVENTNRSIMRYNPNTSGSPLFNCYASGQNDIALYMLEETTPSTKDVIRGGLSAGKWGTICPKQTVEEVEGASFYQITYLEEQGGLPFNVVFDEIGGTTLTAGQPYFFIAEGEEIKGIKTGAELDAADPAGVNGFYGYIGASPLALPNINAEYTAGADNTFVIYNNSVFRINSATNLKSERCYININATEPSRTPSSASPVRRRVVMGVQNTNTATGMDELNASEAPRKMIIDGKMYIFRGEKMYNANGILVK